MKKKAKLTATSLVLTLLAACMCLFFIGCNNAATDYTVILKYEDGTVVNDINGATVQLCLVDNDNDVIYYGEKLELGDNGKVTFKNADKPDADQKYHIVVDNLPIGYTPLKEYYVKKPGTIVITISDQVTYTATAFDNNGDYVTNVWLEIMRYDTEKEQDVSVQKAKTDLSGVARFTFKPVQNTTYSIVVASSGETANEVACPHYYEFVPEESPNYDSDTAQITFGADLNATLVFNYYPNAFSGINTPTLAYSRVHGTPEPTETNQPYTVSLAANRYSYFAFSPYVRPTDDADDEPNVLAASGKYRLTYSANNANVTMFSYVGTRWNISTDANRVPDTVKYITGAAPTDSEYSAEVYTNSDYIELDLDTMIVRDENVFGLVSDSDCTVTVSVVRTGNASYEVPVTNKIMAEFSVDIADCSAVEDGDMLPVPTTPDTSYVKDSNGVYHVNNRNGATIYLMLTQPINENATAISTLPETDAGGNAVFTFDTALDSRGMVLTQTNYLNLVTAYASHVKNDYGVYPLNDELLEFLKCFHGYATENIDNVNLASLMEYCVYFLDEEIIPEPAGNLTEGTNTVTIGSAPKCFTFTPDYTGKYAIRYSGNDGNVEIKIKNSDDSFVTVISVADDTVYYEFDTTADSEITFACYYNGGEGSYSFDVIPVEFVIRVTVPYTGDPFDEYELEFSAPNGSYTISYSGGDENVRIQNEDGDIIIGDNGEEILTESDFTIEDGQSVVFACSYTDASAEQTFTITIRLKTE